METISASIGSGPTSEAQAKREWRGRMRDYSMPSQAKSVIDVLTSLLPFAVGTLAMYWALDAYGYWLTLLLAIPTIGFAVRSFIMFHDAGHGSLFSSKTANKWVGRVSGVVLYNAFGAWTMRHAVHHATVGDLDRRGTGDIPTLTVAEYQDLSKAQQRGYRIFRHPLIMFTIVPIYALVIEPRLIKRSDRRRVTNSTLLNNLALAIYIGLQIKVFGLAPYLLVTAPILIITTSIGVWLFYVQHQFEEVYWQHNESWDFTDAALHGSSFLKLPRILQYFTGNIGFHHVHHMSSKIPNYRLQSAHYDNDDIFANVPTLTLRSALDTMNLALFDEESGKLLTFKEVDQLLAQRNKIQEPATAV